MRYQVRLHPTLDVLVSSVGEVFVPANGPHKAHWTFGSKKNDGYLHVKVNRKNYMVHRLVLEAFVGECPDGMECDHSDRNRCNNALTNLRWASRTDNNRNTSKNDRVDARGGTHRYENKKQYDAEWNSRRSKTHRHILFSDGKRRWLLNSEAIELLKIPVKDRIWHPHH